MREQGTAGKQKTLYGRYDDYMDSHGDQAGEGGHAVRLSEVAAPAHRQGRERNMGRCPTPDACPDRGSRQTGFVVHCVVSDADGETLTVTMEEPDEDGAPSCRKILLTVEQYAVLGIRPGAISSDAAKSLVHAGQLCLAIRKAGELLGYGDMSARSLVRKLTARGIDGDTAVEATNWMVEHGILHENVAALARAAEDARKGWGPRRIRQDVLAHGYTAEATQVAMDTLNDPDDPAFVDFEASCRRALLTRIRGNATILTDRSARGRLMAAMVRLGYGTDAVSEAMREIVRQDPAMDG